MALRIRRPCHPRTPVSRSHSNGGLVDVSGSTKGISYPRSNSVSVVVGLGEHVWLVIVAGSERAGKVSCAGDQQPLAVRGILQICRAWRLRGTAMEGRTVRHFGSMVVPYSVFSMKTPRTYIVRVFDRTEEVAGAGTRRATSDALNAI